jgi:intracellular septation protein A
MRLAASVAGRLAESVVVPLTVFYAVVTAFGLHSALLASLGWAYLAVTVRLVRGGTPPMTLLVTTALATVKAAITFAADSSTAFFLQPTLATYAFAVALLASVPLGRPLMQRLAHDFCPLPAEVTASEHVHRLFRRLSLLWSAVLVVNASLTLGLLLSLSVTWSVPIAGAASVPAFVAGLVASVAWFRRSLRDGGFALRWG